MFLETKIPQYNTIKSYVKNIGTCFYCFLFGLCFSFSFSSIVQCSQSFTIIRFEPMHNIFDQNRNVKNDKKGENNKTEPEHASVGNAYQLATIQQEFADSNSITITVAETDRNQLIVPNNLIRKTVKEAIKIPEEDSDCTFEVDDEGEACSIVEMLASSSSPASDADKETSVYSIEREDSAEGYSVVRKYHKGEPSYEKINETKEISITEKQYNAVVTFFSNQAIENSTEWVSVPFIGITCNWKIEALYMPLPGGNSEHKVFIGYYIQSIHDTYFNNMVDEPNGNYDFLFINSEYTYLFFPLMNEEPIAVASEEDHYETMTALGEQEDEYVLINGDLTPQPSPTVSASYSSTCLELNLPLPSPLAGADSFPPPLPPRNRNMRHSEKGENSISGACGFDDGLMVPERTREAINPLYGSQRTLNSRRFRRDVLAGEGQDSSNGSQNRRGRIRNSKSESLDRSSSGVPENKPYSAPQESKQQVNDCFEPDGIYSLIPADKKFYSSASMPSGYRSPRFQPTSANSLDPAILEAVTHGVIKIIVMPNGNAEISAIDPNDTNDKKDKKGKKGKKK